MKHMKMSLAKSILAPVLFISHGGGPAAFLDFRGSPFHEIDKSSKSASFLRNLDNVVKSANNGEQIKSILVVSAHWEESEFSVDSSDKSKLLYDYYGFPDESYAPHLTYPLQPDVQLAQRAHQLISSYGIKASFKPRREGFDHGTFIPLKLAYPNADIPVAQVSLKSNLNIAEHIALGEALAPLRQEGVLIIGSGQISHNLQVIREPRSASSEKRTVEFLEWIRETMEGTNEHNYEERKQALIAAPRLAPHFAWQHPHIEHFIPLAVAFGASKPQPSGAGGGQGYVAKRVFHDIAMGAMATDSYLFSTGTGADPADA